MATYSGIFIRDYAKSMAMKKYHSGTSMSQIELMISSIIPRLNLNDQILLLLIKPRRRVTS